MDCAHLECLKSWVYTQTGSSSCPRSCPCLCSWRRIVSRLWGVRGGENNKSFCDFDTQIRILCLQDPNNRHAFGKTLTFRGLMDLGLPKVTLQARSACISSKTSWRNRDSPNIWARIRQHQPAHESYATATICFLLASRHPHELDDK